ncbi:MAG: hypothetical protein ACPG8A_00815 [Psychrobium sp.]
MQLKTIIIHIIMFNLEIAFILMWIGAFATYVASEKQQLLTSPIGRNVAWSGLVMTTFVSTWLMSAFYAPVTSLIFSLGILMLSWIFIVILAGHWAKKPMQVCSTGVLSLLLIAQLGGV